MNMNMRPAPSTNEVIKSGLKELADVGVVTLNDVGLLVNKTHRLGTMKKYGGILTDELAKEFFIIETAVWWKLHKDNYDTGSIVELPEDMRDSLLHILNKLNKTDNINIHVTWLTCDLINQLGSLHSHLDTLLDFEGDTLTINSPQQLLLGELKSIFDKRELH